MRKSTIEFIKRLLKDEIDREIIHDNPNPKEVEYVTDLVNATADFIKCYGEFYEPFGLEEQLEELYKDKV